VERETQKPDGTYSVWTVGDPITITDPAGVEQTESIPNPTGQFRSVKFTTKVNTQYTWKAVHPLGAVTGSVVTGGVNDQKSIELFPPAAPVGPGPQGDWWSQYGWLVIAGAIVGGGYLVVTQGPATVEWVTGKQGEEGRPEPLSREG